MAAEAVFCTWNHYNGNHDASAEEGSVLRGQSGGVCRERKNDETTTTTKKKRWVECREAFERLTSGQMGSPETQGFKGAGEKVMQCKRNRPGRKKERREVRRDAWEPDRPITVVRFRNHSITYPLYYKYRPCRRSITTAVWSRDVRSLALITPQPPNNRALVGSSQDKDGWLMNQNIPG